MSLLFVPSLALLTGEGEQRSPKISSQNNMNSAVCRPAGRQYVPVKLNFGTEHHMCFAATSLPFIPSPHILSHHPSIPLPFPPFDGPLFPLFILPFFLSLLTYYIIHHFSTLSSFPFSFAERVDWVSPCCQFCSSSVMPRCSSYYFMHFQNRS